MLLICSEVLEGASSRHLKIFSATERQTQSPLAHARGVKLWCGLQEVQ